MLQEVCEYLNNYFVLEMYSGKYSISGGMISPAVPLKEGQRFLIEGSALNDGVYTFRAAGITNDDSTESASLQNEEFTGTIKAMGVPPSVIAICGEISDWVDKYKDALDSPYYSEDVIGVYSYQKAKSNSSGSDDAGDVTWQSKFSSRLKRWRKLCL